MHFPGYGYFDYDYELVAFAAPAPGMYDDEVAMDSEDAGRGDVEMSSSSLQPVKEIRKNFVETWIFIDTAAK